MCSKKHIVWHPHKIRKKDREKIKGHRACVLWFTGLPSSGKSTIAHELELILNKKGIHTYVLDGDNIRYGLNSDLGFTTKDRRENIRRVSEVAKLFIDAGIVIMVAIISPFRKDREKARSLFKKREFIEIYTKCPISVCKKRDPKGLYQKAIADKIKDFTGISHPYEEPLSPEVLLETDKLSIKASIRKILNYLNNNNLKRGI
jgi:adenylyl-sulfate kinase